MSRRWTVDGDEDVVLEGAAREAWRVMRECDDLRACEGRVKAAFDRMADERMLGESVTPWWPFARVDLRAVTLVEHMLHLEGVADAWWCPRASPEPTSFRRPDLLLLGTSDIIRWAQRARMDAMAITARLDLVRDACLLAGIDLETTDESGTTTRWSTDVLAERLVEAWRVAVRDV